MQPKGMLKVATNFNLEPPPIINLAGVIMHHTGPDPSTTYQVTFDE